MAEFVEEHPAKFDRISADFDEIQIYPFWTEKNKKKLTDLRSCDERFSKLYFNEYKVVGWYSSEEKSRKLKFRPF